MTMTMTTTALLGSFHLSSQSYHLPHLMLLMKAVGAETLWELNVYDGRWEGSLIVLFYSFELFIESHRCMD